MVAVGDKVEILIGGIWEGPFTVVALEGRSPEHLVLQGTYGRFEHYADWGYNIRTV